MSTQIEEIVLRMKLDAAQAEISAQNMLSRERGHAREYVGFWKGALAKREAAEISTAESIAAKTLAIERDAAGTFAMLWQGLDRAFGYELQPTLAGAPASRCQMRRMQNWQNFPA